MKVENLYIVPNQGLIVSSVCYTAAEVHNPKQMQCNTVRWNAGCRRAVRGGGGGHIVDLNCNEHKLERQD